LQFFEEMEFQPDGQLSFEQQILKSLENRRVRPPPELTDDTILDQYHFAVTGKIMIRCRRCRSGYNRTEQEVLHDRFLQPMLIGDPATCSWCHTGHVKRTTELMSL